MKKTIVFVFILFLNRAHGADEVAKGPPPQRPPAVKAHAVSEDDSKSIPKAKWNEVYSLIDDIKVQNPPRNYMIRLKAGLTQISSNTGDAVNLGLQSNIPSVGIDGIAGIWGNVGMEARFIYAQNAVTAQLADGTSSPNTASSYIYWVDVGPRYTFYFDSTHLDDNVSLKILYHQNDSNFQINDVNDRLFVSHYAGISASVERSIPITRKLGVLATFDLLQIFAAQLARFSDYALAQGTQPTYVLQQAGYGFEVRGEIYYQIQMFSRPARLGFAYWQQGNNNEVDDTTKSNIAKTSYFQLARALYLNLSFNY